MEDCLVKDLMVPLTEYATVQEGATLFEAVLALEKAQLEFDHTRYRHRGVLVLDKKNNQVIGKLGYLDVLFALVPKNEVTVKKKLLGLFGFSSQFIRNLEKASQRSDIPLKSLCSEAAKLKVEDFMQARSEGGCIEENTTLEAAIEQLTTGNHLSLLVTKGTVIAGILRLPDVFAAVFHTMKETEISP